jgi:hypothetical protein
MRRITELWRELVGAEGVYQKVLRGENIVDVEGNLQI